MSKKDKNINHEEELVNQNKEIENHIETPEEIESEIHNEAEKENLDEVSELKLEVSKLKDSLLRKAAEFENFKKRRNDEMSEFYKYASENIIKSLIPVYDDLSRSIDSINKGETKDFETLKTGVQMIYDKFRKVLEDEGLKEINSLGNEFDVEVNEALMQMPKENAKPNTVLEVIEKGYKLKDKVIKHEKVIVSQ
ncbi:MAG TPA: nucleotide exchange factor GrpE [Bacteroidetes bacterium]|nr:nucleotide exchange factor GrpE [Bacteroidota bacterium]HCN37962.1 nucleotide exchange factor GrpE [Bacteroidota bacterium]